MRIILNVVCLFIPSKNLRHKIREINFGVLLLKLLQPFFEQDTYILFDNLAGKTTECIDAYSLFTYMRDNGMKVYYCVWRKNKFYEKLERNNNLQHVIVLNKKHAYREFLFVNFWRLLKAKYVITSFGGLPGSVTHFLYNNKRVTYFRIGHGKTFFKTFHLLGGHLEFNKCLVSCKAEQTMLSNLGWSLQNMPLLGLPRWDMLTRTPSRQKNIFVMFTWRRSFLRRWRKKYSVSVAVEDSNYFKSIDAFVNDPQLKEILAENDVKMKFALHHALVDLVRSKLPDFKNIEIVAPMSISKHIGAANLLITDYSSVAFDFLFLDTPVIFYRPDFNDMKLAEADVIDFNSAKEQDGKLFNICYERSSAIELLKQYIKNDFLLEDENKKKAAQLFAVRENIRAAIVEHLG